jgi:hypothetical protein
MLGHATVVAAVERDLEQLGEQLAGSALAATALALARELDDVVAEEKCEACGHVQPWTTGHNSATSKSMCARALTEIMERLAELAPPKTEGDQVDDLSARRAGRLARSAAASHPPHT